MRPHVPEPVTQNVQLHAALVVAERVRVDARTLAVVHVRVLVKEPAQELALVLAPADAVVVAEAAPADAKDVEAPVRATARPLVVVAVVAAVRADARITAPAVAVVVPVRLDARAVVPMRVRVVGQPVSSRAPVFLTRDCNGGRYD